MGVYSPRFQINNSFTPLEDSMPRSKEIQGVRVIGEGVVESEAGGKEVLLSSLRVVDRKTLASRKLKEYFKDALASSKWSGTLHSTIELAHDK